VDSNVPSSAEPLPSPSGAVPPASHPRPSGLWRPLGQVVPNRLAVFLAMWLGMVLFPPRPPPSGVQLGNRPNAGNLFLDGWLRWDVHWYWHIATRGYTNVPEVNGAQRDTNFFPLLPWLTHLVHAVIPNAYVAGMLVTNVAFLFAALLLHRLAALRGGEPRADRALLLLLAFPFSFIFSAMYTESLFFLAVVAAFYFGELGQWPKAALAAALAGLTRVPGVLVPFALGLLYLEKIRFRPTAIRRDVLWLGLGFAGLLLHMGHLWLRFGDPLLFVKTQQVQGWMAGHRYGELWDIFRSVFSLPALMHGRVNLVEVFGLFVSIAAAIACAVCIQRGQLAWGVWGLLSLAVSLKLPASLGRYTMMIFPLYLVGADFLRGAVLRFLTTAGLFFGLCLMVLWSHWTFVC
jgi:hypothetical protein